MTQEEMIEAPIEAIDLFVNQSRERFDEDELIQLAGNIKANGQLQPGVAWFDSQRRRYILFCGERRLRALKHLNRQTMLLKVLHGTMTQSQMLQMNMSENIQRASLNPIERAKGFQRLIQLGGITAREAAERMNLSEGTISKDLSLLELSESLQEQVIAGVLPASVGAYIARIDDEEVRRAVADRYVSGDLTREGVVAEVKRFKGKRVPSAIGRLACRIDGVSITASGKTLTMDTLLKAIEQIRRKAKELGEGGDVTELAKSLKAS